MTNHPSHTAMLEGRLLTMRQEVRRAVAEVRKALDELDRADAEVARCLIGIRAIEGDMQAMGRRSGDKPTADESNLIGQAKANAAGFVPFQDLGGIV